MKVIHLSAFELLLGFGIVQPMDIALAARTLEFDKDVRICAGELDITGNHRYVIDHLFYSFCFILISLYCIVFEIAVIVTNCA